MLYLNLKCEFSKPVNLGSPENADWEYSEMNCLGEGADETEEQIVNASTGATFTIEKTFSYGDVFFIILAIILLSYFVAHAVFSYLWKK
jgi:hypothetical protein